MSTTTEDNPSISTSDSLYPPAGVGWYATVLLAVLYWLSILDRTIISLLVDPIKADLNITDVQFGMLHGLAFAITFSLFGIVAGAFADRFNRRIIIFASVTIWSAATAACGLAQNFWHLLLARIGVGAGEAGLNPCATSMITDLFPPQKLTLALAIYSMGASVGAGCAFLFGGMLIDIVSQANLISLPLIGEVSPWQSAFFIVGVPGLAASFLVFTMPEPRRIGQLEKQETHEKEPVLKSISSSYRNLLKFIDTRRRFFFFHYLGFGLGSLCFVGGSAWYPAHMSRTFGWSATEIGLTLGLTLVIAGLVGKLICGFAVGKLYERGYRDAQFLWYAMCLVLALPAGVIACTSTSPVVFIIGIGLFLILLSPINAVCISSLNLVTPNRLRGSGVAFYSATVGLIALSLGPIMIAAFSDYLFGGDAIGRGLAMTMAVCCPLGAITLFLGRRAMREAVSAAENVTAS